MFYMGILSLMLLAVPTVCPGTPQQPAEVEVEEIVLPEDHPADSVADIREMMPDEIRERLRLRELALEGHELIANTDLSRAEREHGVDLTIEAALLGDPVAQNNLGYLAATGYASLVDKDPEKALFWYRKALDARYPAAAVNIIDLPGRYPDLEIPDEVLAEANLLMGDAYARGTDVIPYNFNLSLSHYLQAARFGSGRAVMILRELLGQFPDALGPLTDEDAALIYGGIE